MVTSAVHPVVTAEPTAASGWVEQALLSGATPGLRRLAVSVVTVAAGRSRHPSQSDDEQVVIVVDGWIRLAGVACGQGQFAFLPRRMPHTLTVVGPGAATYVSVAWGDDDPGASTLAFSRFDAAGEGPLGGKVHAWGSRQRQCDASTAHLAALRSHVSLMTPGASYAPHADPYDVVIVTLDGIVETLERTVPPHHVIVYPAGSLHGMHNPGPDPARYVVLELHSRRNADHLPRPSLLARLSDPRRWRRRLARLVRR